MLDFKLGKLERANRGQVDGKECGGAAGRGMGIGLVNGEGQ